VPEPARGAREVFEPDVLERPRQTRLAEVGEGERREAVEGELLGGRRIPQTSLGAADDDHGGPQRPPRSPVEAAEQPVSGDGDGARAQVGPAGVAVHVVGRDPVRRSGRRRRLVHAGGLPAAARDERGRGE
jgi:hypothetical protein